MTLVLLGPNDMPILPHYIEMLCDGDLATSFDAASAARQAVYVDSDERWFMRGEINRWLEKYP